VILLLPPSEGKAEGGRAGSAWAPDAGSLGAALGSQRSEVATALDRSGGGDARLLGVKGEALARARSANVSLIGSPVLPAWQRYTGVVWDHLNLSSMPGAARNSALRRLFVPSGLMGLVRADDPVPDYKLKMGAVLAPMGRLSRWWKPAVTSALSRLARNHVVVNLLPKEHSEAVDWSGFERAVRIELVAHRSTPPGGHFAKAAKGALARHLLEHPDAPIARSVATFRHPTHTARIT
jgi:cytoplasmic iron level regulating protein YaaA (DUF328/UPF0246 family)